jgi:hypothetical protein
VKGATVNCPECGAGPFLLTPGEAPPEPTPADVEIARVNASAAERAMLIERGINPDTMHPLDGADTALDVAEVHADAAVEIATEEASADVAAAEAVGDAMVAAAEVVGDALATVAEVVTDDASDELPDEILVTSTEGDGEGDEEASGAASRASRWGFR